ncbi:hypothetical protein ACEU6F_22200, partial [Aeromonas salmonicida]|uniref:hypothetical protein n=1 Tax=Aeromonas salmonicida TaxID=645 RepID=UPI0035A67FA4
RLKSVKAILTIKLTAYHRPISICFVGKKLFLIFNKMFTISPWAQCHAPSSCPCGANGKNVLNTGQRCAVYQA